MCGGRKVDLVYLKRPTSTKESPKDGVMFLLFGGAVLFYSVNKLFVML